MKAALLTDEVNMIRVDSQGVLLVSISDNPEAIPLKDLTNRLEEYFNIHGSTGDLRIQIFYKNDEEELVQWKPKNDLLTQLTTEVNELTGYEHRLGMTQREHDIYITTIEQVLSLLKKHKDE